MKALRYHSLGGPEVLAIEDIPTPEPAEGQILVKVAGCGVNPADWKRMAGKFGKTILPATFGLELSGTVTKLGAGVTSFEVGDEIIGETEGFGAAAEYAVLKASSAAKRPMSLDFADSAGLVVVGMTAWQALFDHGDIQTGQRVLIHGAAGGVGSMAVQLAKWKGAYVIGTGSAESAHFIKELGADLFIDYTKEDVAEAAGGVDFVLESIGGSNVEISRKALKKGGILVSLVGPVDNAPFEAEGKRSTNFSMSPDTTYLEKLRDLVEDDKLNLVIDTELPLARAAEAVAESLKGHARGKIIIRVS